MARAQGYQVRTFETTPEFGVFRAGFKGVGKLYLPCYIFIMSAWGDDDLSQFFDMVHENQKGNRVNFASAYEVILKINDCLSLAGKNLANIIPVMVGILFLRCLYAYKTAAGMALAGQVVETFAIMRSALEYAGYALVIFEDPTLENVFINRHQSESEMKLQKEKFKIGAVRAAISRFDTKLAENFDTFYQRAIDFGGHPNPHATFSATKIEVHNDNSGITTLALSTDPTATAHALKSVAQVGLTVLYIFQHIFTAKFELLGIRAKIDALRRGGGL